MAAAPARKSSALTGMCLPRPPSASSDRVRVCVSTLPAPKKSSDLKSEWLNVWSSAPHRPQAATVSLPAARPRVPTPAPMRMTPTFSMLE